MAATTATQLTVTIPDGAPPGSILSIPVKGRAETIKARVPAGLGPGSTLILTQHEGSDEWIEQAGQDVNAESVPDALQRGAANTEPVAEPQPPYDEDDGLIPSGPVAYTVRLNTSVGNIDIIVRPDWAPHGARRFLELVRSGDLDGLAFYRSVKGCLAQFGLPTKRQWPPLPDDPSTGVPFLLGAVCFAAVGSNSRKSTLFICIGDMSQCFGHSPWETPIGAVAESSLDALDRIETIYGDIAECGGTGPDTTRINAEGNDYLRTSFPLLTYIRSAAALDWPPSLEPGAGSVTTQLADPQPMAAPHDPQGAHAADVAAPVPVQSAAGAPINVPVEIVTAASEARGRSGAAAVDVPIEVCASARKPPAAAHQAQHVVRSSSASRVVGSGSHHRSGSVGAVARFHSTSAHPLAAGARPASVATAQQQPYDHWVQAHSHPFHPAQSLAPPQGYQQLQPPGFQPALPGFSGHGVQRQSSAGYALPPAPMPFGTQPLAPPGGPPAPMPFGTQPRQLMPMGLLQVPGLPGMGSGPLMWPV